MTEPEQVLVNVDDLRGLAHVREVCRIGSIPVNNLIAAIPEPEWEPTDDMVDGADRALLACKNGMNTTAFLKFMHREGLL